MPSITCLPDNRAVEMGHGEPHLRQALLAILRAGSPPAHAGGGTASGSTRRRE